MHILNLIFILFFLSSCLSPQKKDLTYHLETEKTLTDTDDPAIWYNQNNPSETLVIGTDKDNENGGLYVFDLNGKILKDKTVLGLKRPNNVDIEYGLKIAGKYIDIAVLTERGRNKIRVFSVPDFKAIDKGGISVFENETLKSPMGIALYKSNIDSSIYAIVSRKNGPQDGYLHQYKLVVKDNHVEGLFVRSFGKFSANKEIEAVLVDDELEYVYYSDEGFGIRKYWAEPGKGNQELAVFGRSEFRDDIEGLSILKTEAKKGYILASDQQANSFNVFSRENNEFLRSFTITTNESDGSDIIGNYINDEYKNGLFVAMSDNARFQYFKVEQILNLLKKN